MRLIDADALREWLIRAGRFLKIQDDSRSAAHAIGKIIDHLDRMPTVDAVPVVRCGKCKHWRPYGRDFVLKKDYGRCEKPDNESLVKYNASPYEDWFCADGERKGGDE